MGTAGETQSCPGGASPVLANVRYGRVAAWIWLALLGFPLAELLAAHVSSLHRALVLAGFAAFVAAFVLLMLAVDGRLTLLALLFGTWDRPRMAARSGLVVLMFCIAVAMTAGDRGGWASMFIYTAAVASMWMRFSTRAAALAVVMCVVSATALVAARGAGTGTIFSVGATCAGVGFLMLSFGQLRLRNLELLRARDEIARLAVAEERLRFARDLHDLLGHSLSVIALKAELAGRMLERDVEEAATHVADIEQPPVGVDAEDRRFDARRSDPDRRREGLAVARRDRALPAGRMTSMYTMAHQSFEEHVRTRRFRFRRRPQSEGHWPRDA